MTEDGFLRSEVGSKFCVAPNAAGTMIVTTCITLGDEHRWQAVQSQQGTRMTVQLKKMPPYPADLLMAVRESNLYKQNNSVSSVINGNNNNNGNSNL